MTSPRDRAGQSGDTNGATAPSSSLPDGGPRVELTGQARAIGGGSPRDRVGRAQSDVIAPGPQGEADPGELLRVGIGWRWRRPCSRRPTGRGRARPIQVLAAAALAASRLSRHGAGACRRQSALARAPPSAALAAGPFAAAGAVLDGVSMGLASRGCRLASRWIAGVRR